LQAGDIQILNPFCIHRGKGSNIEKQKLFLVFTSSKLSQTTHSKYQRRKYDQQSQKWFIHRTIFPGKQHKLVRSQIQINALQHLLQYQSSGDDFEDLLPMQTLINKDDDFYSDMEQIKILIQKKKQVLSSIKRVTIEYDIYTPLVLLNGNVPNQIFLNCVKICIEHDYFSSPEHFFLPVSKLYFTSIDNPFKIIIENYNNIETQLMHLWKIVHYDKR